MIESESARKYILYAIGEILLVMIGILLALQVNNWNEWRKERQMEKKLLIELQENLRADIAFCKKQMEVQSILIRNIEKLISQLEAEGNPKIPRLMIPNP